MSVISATPSRAGTLSPPYTSTNGSAITRADFQRWAHEDRNHAQADATRQEREKRLRFKQEQKELMRSRGAAIKDAQKAQMQTAASMVHEHREENAQLGSTLRTDEDRLRKRRTDQQKKWADHGYELTQQYTIKAAQNNMRSLKAQNAGVVNGMHAKRQEHQQIIESQRQAAQGERRQRVERVRAETTDTVTRNAKKAYVDERWDMADGMREKAEQWRSQRKAQELAYLEQALAINAATSIEPAKAAREREKERRNKASTEQRDRKKQLKQQAVADDSSYSQAKSAIHDSIHGLKFVPDEEVKTISKADASNTRLKPFFSFRTPSRRTGPHQITL